MFRVFLLHETQQLPLLPKRLQAKTMLRSSPYPYLSISWPHKQISILSGRCTCGFQSCHPLEAALSFRIWGVLYPASMQWFRKTCCVTLGHGGIQGDIRPQESGFSTHPSEKQKKLLSHYRPHGFHLTHQTSSLHGGLSPLHPFKLYGFFLLSFSPHSF